MSKLRVALLLSITGLLVLGAGAVGAVVLWRNTRSVPANHCTVGAYQLGTAQASVAATMVGEVSRYHPALPERAAVLALAAGLQESKLTNLPPGQGDRDSVGVLQQRPSQGWGGGDPKRLNDVREATREFLAALIKIPDWQSMPLAKAVQDVQVSADGSLYAQHEPEAKALADALQGHRAAGITCTFSKPASPAPTRRVAAFVRRELPINSPRLTGTQVRVPGAHWQTAAWFIANAHRFGIDSVGYDGKVWSREHGWRTAVASSAAVVATMQT